MKEKIAGLLLLCLSCVGGEIAKDKLKKARNKPLTDLEARVTALENREEDEENN